MTDEPDALVGLRFEVGGGLSRMTGRVLGKASGLYLVQKTDATYSELLQIDDLRSAKFYRDSPTGSTVAPVAEPAAAPTVAPESAEPAGESGPAKRRLAEHLRRSLGLSDDRT